MTPTEMTPVGRYYVEHLPYWPYCAQGLGAIYKRPRAKFKHYTHIEHNEPTLVRWLVFDLDRSIHLSMWNWELSHIPAPNILVINPENRHAHAFYKLEQPVCRSEHGSKGPLEYLAHIENGFCELLKGDRGYSGLISKNPFHPDWETYFVHNHGYTLNELDDAIPDVCYIRSKSHSETYGLGRNCSVFELLKQWAYRAYRSFGFNNKGWYEACLEKAEEYNLENCGAVPLAHNELKGIAKSVAKWVAGHFSAREFKLIQAARGKQKGKELRDQYLDKVIELTKRGMKPSEVVASLGALTPTIISNWTRRYC